MHLHQAYEMVKVELKSYAAFCLFFYLFFLFIILANSVIYIIVLLI